MSQSFGKLLNSFLRRSNRHGDPANGIEYNKFSTHTKTSRKVYSVDIARTPQIVNQFFQRIDVHGEAWKANHMRHMVDYRRSNMKGRGF